MKVTSNPYFFYLLVFAVAAASLSAIWILVQPQPRTLEYELSKLLLQFLVLVVVGGGLKYGIDQHQNGRDIQTRKLESYRHLLKELSDNYSKVKRIRRELRLELAIDGTLPFDAYHKKILELVDVQLELEILNQDLKFTSQDASPIQDNVKEMETFLKSVIDGRRESIGESRVENGHVDAGRLSAAEQGFLSEGPDNPWYLGYVIPLRAARMKVHSKASLV